MEFLKLIEQIGKRNFETLVEKYPQLKTDRELQKEIMQLDFKLKALESSYKKVIKPILKEKNKLLMMQDSLHDEIADIFDREFVSWRELTQVAKDKN